MIYRHTPRPDQHKKDVHRFVLPDNTYICYWQRRMKECIVIGLVYEGKIHVCLGVNTKLHHQTSSYSSLNDFAIALGHHLGAFYSESGKIYLSLPAKERGHPISLNRYISDYVRDGRAHLMSLLLPERDNVNPDDAWLKTMLADINRRNDVQISGPAKLQMERENIRTDHVMLCATNGDVVKDLKHFTIKKLNPDDASQCIRNDPGAGNIFIAMEAKQPRVIWTGYNLSSFDKLEDRLIREWAQSHPRMFRAATPSPAPR